MLCKKERKPEKERVEDIKSSSQIFVRKKERKKERVENIK